MLREIVMDTETTGLDPANGDRLIELGCIEIVNRIPTGREFHRYLNPERDIHRDAVAVHGLTAEFLKDKPLFKDVADEFLEFIGDAPLVAHNATFDVGFLNAELERASRPPLRLDRVVDTLVLARRRHPAGPNSLDALCKRYGIDNSKRTKHGALMNSLLLASVYVELLGERQATLGSRRAGRRRIRRASCASQPPSHDRSRCRRGSREAGARRTASSSRRWAQKRSGCAIHRRPRQGEGLPNRTLNSSSACTPGCALLLALHEQRGEIDRIEQQRREAAFARQVGDDAAQEREQQRGTVDQQERLERLLGQVLDLEQAGIGELEIVDHAGLAGRPRP